MKAFIFDPLWDELLTEELSNQLEKSGLELIVIKEVAPISKCKALYAGDEERILCINPDYVGWKLSSDDYKNIPNLKAILGAATSFSWIDASYANEKNIPICNIRNFSTEAVAEWAIMMLFNVARQIPCLIKNKFPLDFDKDFMKYRGIELHGKTAAIIGLGHIGSAITKRLQGLGMKVVYWSQSEKECEYERMDLENIFKTADVVFPTMAINDETKKVITKELLTSMKPSAMIISIVHGLFDEEAVLEMVKNKKLFGFGFEGDPASFEKYEGNVFAAPAYAWATDGSMNNSMTKWIENMVNASQNKFPTRVN